jgi:S1-C subfamily serine protease
VRTTFVGSRNGKLLFGRLAALGAISLAAAAIVCVPNLVDARGRQAQTTSQAQTKSQDQVHSAASSTDDPATAALCPVVYPDDQTPQSRGYHYTFFGNAFFINEDGYLLTVAHVVATFGDGGQPYILVNRPEAPPRLLKISVIAKDTEHDVAILRATPNPFAGSYKVAYVSLASTPAVRGQAVLALSLHPQRLQDAHSFEAQREDTSPGTVLSYETTQLEKSGPAADVFLLSHPVVKGQSGSPVLAMDSHGAVGLVEGLWLRATPGVLSKSGAQAGATPGAAIPIRYALALLKENGVTWHSAGPSASPAGHSSSH